MPNEPVTPEPQPAPAASEAAPVPAALGAGTAVAEPPAESPPPPEPEPTPAHAEDVPPAAADEAGQAEVPETPGETPPPPPAPPVAEATPPPPPPSNKRWYVVKVQSGREESIKDAIERRVKIEGLEDYVGQIIIPVEKVQEMRRGKRVTRTRKLYPGYLMCEVEYNDRILYLFRETSGVGDFVGGSVNRDPPPMSDREVEAMLGKQLGLEGSDARVVTSKPKYDRGDKVKVKDGTFAGMEGEVKELIETRNLVRVGLTIFGREVPVELEYWQVEPV